MSGKRKIVFVGSKDDLVSFPKHVVSFFGRQLRALQFGIPAEDVKPMKSVGHGVFEIRRRDF